MIYEYLLPYDIRIVNDDSTPSIAKEGPVPAQPFAAPKILQVCRQIRNEALPDFYASMLFTFSDSRKMLGGECSIARWLPPRHILQHVTSLSFFHDVNLTPHCKEDGTYELPAAWMYVHLLDGNCKAELKVLRDFLRFCLSKRLCVGEAVKVALVYLDELGVVTKG